MINLNLIKVFHVEDMPSDIKPFKILNHEQLHVISEEIKNLPKDNSSEWTANEQFIEIIWRMIATCLENNSIAISAPQVGIFKHFFVMRFFDLSGEGIYPLQKNLNTKPFIVLMNPSWTTNNRSSSRVEAIETCSSVPGEFIPVERPHSITVEYTTLNKKNQNYFLVEELVGWKARVFLHEWELLNGKTLLDYKK